LVKDENWSDCRVPEENYFSPLLTVHGVSDVKQMEIHTAEPSAPGHSALEVKIATEKFERYKSPSTDQILADMIHKGGETLHCEIYQLIHSIWKKVELLRLWNKPIIIPIYKKGIKLPTIVIEAYCYYQLHTKFYSIPLPQS
jgi:hypothetical protein